jgi:hypothetical protein
MVLCHSSRGSPAAVSLARVDYLGFPANRLIVGHPLIHLAYAFEYQHPGVGTECLSLCCTEHDTFSGFLQTTPPDTSTYKTTSFLEVMQHVRDDKRFDGLLEQPGAANWGPLSQEHQGFILEHWNAWERTGTLLQQLEQICDVSALLALSSGSKEHSYDFFLIHIMTVAHAFRVMWNEFSEEVRESLINEYALWTITLYAGQLRRPFGIEHIECIDLKGRDWAWAIRTALEHRGRLDSHFFKVVSAPKVFAETFGEKDGFYLKALVKFLEEYKGWKGFGVGTDGVDPAEFSKLE